MHTDPISDFLIRLKNAQNVGKRVVESPSSRMKFTIAKILEREGYVSSVVERTEGPKKTITVELNVSGDAHGIRSVTRVSKPGRRVYRAATELPRVLSDIGIAIVSTSMGVMTNKEARKRKLGGEVLCEIY